MADSVPNSTLTKRPVIFLGVGVSNTLFDFTFYTFLTLTFFRGGRHIAVAGIISGTAALICAFATHSLITWRGSHISHRTVLKFIAFTGFGMWVIRPILLASFIHLNWLYSWTHMLSQKLHLSFGYDFIANTGAFGFMAAILLVYNYYTYNRFVFNRRAGQLPRTEQENHSKS